MGKTDCLGKGNNGSFSVPYTDKIQPFGKLRFESSITFLILGRICIYPV